MKPILPHYRFRRKRVIIPVSVIDIIGKGLFYPLKWEKPPKDVKRVLMIRLDHIGDVVCSTPVFREWKANYPKSKLTVLTSRWGRQVLDSNPYIDDFIVMDHHWFKRQGKQWDRAELTSIIKRLRRERFDTGISLRGDFREILLMFFGGVKYRVGYGVTGGGFLLHNDVFYKRGQHEVESNLRLIRALGCTIGNVKTEVHVSAEKLKKAKEMLAHASALTDKPRVCVHVGAAYTSKQWPIERFSKIIHRLVERRDVKVILIGSPEEILLGKSLESDGSVVNLIGRTDIGLLCALLKSCSLFVGNDSGPSHLAAALGVPVVIIASGTNNYDKWGVWTQRKIVLRSIVECMPCNLRKCVKPRHLCMEQISEDEVYQAIVKSLDQEIGVFE